MRVLILGAALLATAQQATAQRGPQRTVPRPPTMAGKSVVYAPNGMAATSQPLATEVAREAATRPAPSGVM